MRPSGVTNRTRSCPFAVRSRDTGINRAAVLRPGRRGQTSMEVALLILAVLVIAAVAAISASGFNRTVTSGVGSAIDVITSETIARAGQT